MPFAATNCEPGQRHASHLHSFNHQILRNGQNSDSNPSSFHRMEINSKGKMRWILSLGLLLPALAAIIGIFFNIFLNIFFKVKIYSNTLSLIY